MIKLIENVQGDVAFETIAALPDGLKKRNIAKLGDSILARGEFSDHAHFATGEVEVLDAEDGTMYLDVKGEAEIQHLLESSGVWTKEHKPLKLTPGYYKVELQNQYNPYAKAIERVRD